MAKLANHLDKTYLDYGMKFSNAEKTKLITKNTNSINAITRKELETVASFKYVGATFSDELSKPEALSIIAQTSAALSRLKLLRRAKNNSQNT